MNASAASCDYDVLVIGSGFGGRLTALRLTEKGCRVGVLEAGRRFEDADYPAIARSAGQYRVCGPWAPGRGPSPMFREGTRGSTGFGTANSARPRCPGGPDVSDYQ